jgi:hypothetical protein
MDASSDCSVSNRSEAGAGADEGNGPVGSPCAALALTTAALRAAALAEGFTADMGFTAALGFAAGIGFAGNTGLAGNGGLSGNGKSGGAAVSVPGSP